MIMLRCFARAGLGRCDARWNERRLGKNKGKSSEPLCTMVKEFIIIGAEKIGGHEVKGGAGVQGGIAQKLDIGACTGKACGSYAEPDPAAL